MKYISNCTNHCNSTITPSQIPQVASMPYELYLSLQGKYFVGYGDNLTFGEGKSGQD